MCADPGARTPIGTSGNSSRYCDNQGETPPQSAYPVSWTKTNPGNLMVRVPEVRVIARGSVITPMAPHPHHLQDHHCQVVTAVAVESSIGLHMEVP